MNKHENPPIIDGAYSLEGHVATQVRESKPVTELDRIWRLHE